MGDQSLMVAGLDGLMLQYMCEPDEARADGDLDVLIEMVIHIARVRAVLPERPDASPAQNVITTAHHHVLDGEV